MKITQRLPRQQFYSLETDGAALRDWVADLAAGTAVRSIKCPECQHETE